MQAENWISITISALNYRILLEKNSLITVDIDREKKKNNMRITMKGLASLNYNFIFKILCMPKIIPFECRISLLCDLCVLSVHTSLPESQDAPDDLVYMLWFVQSDLVWSPGSN